ncbi:MAG: prepilin-type N-terminal cleavage/methylation domain-containing protein [Phycisphaerales bacterium]|nr:prepilin-type N-terminal cleavage/methylation domain-containing protein [Phycisphaerales bacterium]
MSLAATGPARRARAAFTLIEIVISLALISIIAIASAGVMRLAARAASGSGDPRAEASGPAEALRQIMQDLQLATSVLRADSTGMSVEVPDRDADGKPETIEYEWDGVSGSTATRSINGSPASPLLVDVAALDFSLDVATLSVGATAQSVPEAIVVTAPQNSGGTGVVTIDRAVGVYLSPALGTNDRTWKPTRVRVYMSRAGIARGNVSVELRVAPADAPSGTLLAGWTINDTTLSAGGGYVTFAVPAGVTLDRDTKVALLVRAASSDTTVSVRTSLRVPPTASTIVTKLDSNGTTWVRVPDNTAFAELYAETMTATGATSQKRAVRATVGVSVGGMNSTLPRHAVASVVLLNKPVMP